MNRQPEKTKAPASTNRKGFQGEESQSINKGTIMSNSTALTIGATSVRQVGDLYSLNDLHKASGGEDKHQPAKFVRMDQTQSLIVEIENSPEVASLGTAGIPAVKTKEGRGGGTYACKELVIAYAAWISAAFHLKVIRVFLAHVAPKAQTQSTAMTLVDCGDKAKVAKFLVAMRKRAVLHLVQLDKQISEWEVLAAPPPTVRMKFQVDAIGRALNGEWVMDVVSGMCGLRISVPHKVMPRGGVKIGDKLTAHHLKSGNPWVGPWVKVEHQDAAKPAAIKYEFGTNYAAPGVAA